MLSTIDVFVRGEWLWIKYNQVSKSQGFQAGGPRGRGGGKRKRPLGLEKKEAQTRSTRMLGLTIRGSCDPALTKFS